jgi:phospholipid/cholesterol/gamma-HCH transport system substrate-binding protein
MKRKVVDFYIGIFVLAALAAAGFMILKFGGMATRNRYEVVVLFDAVEGLVNAAPVYHAGVECGNVKRIIPHGMSLPGRPDVPRDKVKVIISLERHTDLRSGDEVKVRAVSLLGEVAVEIVPGPLDAPTLPKRDERDAVVVVGTNPEGLLDPLREIVGPVPDVMENLRRFTAEEGPLTETVRGLNRLINESFPAVVENIADIAVEAEKLLAENRAQISNVIANMDQTVESSSAFMENLKRLTGERGSLTETVQELRGAADDFRRVARGLQPIVADIRAGKGGLGMLINDPSWYENFSKLLLAMRKYGLLHPEKGFEDEEKEARGTPREPTVWVR